MRCDVVSELANGNSNFFGHLIPGEGDMASTDTRRL